MKGLRRGWKRFTGFMAGHRRETELAEEIETHLRMQTEDNLRLGMSPEEARRAAVLKFGGIESVKESYRDQRGLPSLEAVVMDIRHAFRSLHRNPQFAAAAIVSLALGIGATTAIFGLADSVLLEKMPYAHPDRLVTVSVNGAISAPIYEAFRQDAHSLQQAALFTSWYFNLVGQGEPERIPAARVSASLFRLLGVSPELGRTFAAEEDHTGCDNVVLIADGLWKRRFGADPNIIGRTLTLNDAAYTVIGVMPSGFRFPEGPEHHATVGPFPPAEMWRPMALADWEQSCEGCFNFAMLARLRPATTASQASAELTAILYRLAGPKKAQAPPVTVLNLHQAVTGKARAPLLILFGAVTLALLIACVNVAHLLLARGLRRRQEIALRLALGATRARLVQHELVEALTFSLCAAALAVPVAWATIHGLVAIAPADMPRIIHARVDARIFGFALLLALATALLFGIAPAVLTARRAPGEVMKTGARTTTAAPSRLRASLVVAEFALSLVLLIGAGLLAKSFVAVSNVPLGFHAENVLTMQLSFPNTRYDDQRRAMLIDRLVANCRSIPGVTAAAATSTLPLTGEAEGWGLLAEDNPDRNASIMARVRAVTPGYFRALGIRLRAGRDFEDSDRATNPIAILSESAARRIWPGVANPLGRRLLDKPPITVIGIVNDTHASGIDAEVRPYLYVPFAQFAPPEFALAIRSASLPASLIKAVKEEVWRIDKDQPVTQVATMEQLVADSVAPRRFQAAVMTSFAAFALILAAVGIYGVLSYSVAQRTHEIGIRLALGASRWTVISGVLKQACLLALAGAGLGLLAVLCITPLLRSLLYGVVVSDQLVWLGCAALLIVVAVVASLLPALRASRLDAMTCLRYE
jgi:predicted permease